MLLGLLETQNTDAISSGDPHLKNNSHTSYRLLTVANQGQGHTVATIRKYRKNIMGCEI